MLNDFELEELEKKYLDYIVTSLQQDLRKVMTGLNSRIKILNDWKTQFLNTARKSHKQPSDLDTGAERVFHNLFAPMFRFPNTCPIGSDMVYEIEGQAIIHIEVKTTLITNPDFKGKVQLGRNQISYQTTKFKPSIPPIYKSISVPALTYVIQIVHEHMKPKINALNVICIPNGQLSKYYGEIILNAGKRGWTKANDIRYSYAKQPLFLLLTERDKRDIFRIEILLLDKNLTIKDLTGKDLSLKPYKII
ncbi:MAG: hypothetical protein AB1488_02885 [Nitrospirota bacterium]